MSTIKVGRFDAEVGLSGTTLTAHPGRTAQQRIEQLERVQARAMRELLLGLLADSGDSDAKRALEAIDAEILVLRAQLDEDGP